MLASTRPSPLLALLASALAPLLLSCSGAQTSASEAAQRGLCPASQHQTEPLIVEWSSGARGKLESLRSKHVVAVRYTGCDLEVLPQCEVPARYSYAPITPKHEHVRVRDERELFANIPLHAAALSGKLKSAGELNVKMTVVGRFEAERAGVRADELKGECEGATHVITGLTAGAFTFFSGSDKTAGGGFDVAGLNNGASVNAKRETLNEDGDPRACASSSAADKAPPFGCGALIRVELLPLGGTRQATPTCSASTQWDGKQCVTVATGSCPPGTLFAQGNCIPEDGKNCPAAYHLDEARGCVSNGPPAAPGACQPGYHHEGGGCAPDPAGPSPMVRIPGGTFRMGCSNGASDCSPSHLVTVAPFEIDLFEVTLASFKGCVDAGKCLPTPTHSDCNWGKDGRERRPINCVDWHQARIYCGWIGRRLPTEAEWEFAAVGQTGWIYPWGNERPDKTRSCWGESDTSSATCPVGKFPLGKSRFGLLDMTGNVAEWMEDAHCTYTREPSETRYCDPKRRVVRDGYPAAGRTGLVPEHAGNQNGFRCAKSI